MCDIIYASKSAKLGQPEIKLGTIPGGGGTQRLTRLLGKYKSMELILSGEPISSEEAKRIGLVNDVIDDEKLMDLSLEMARKISTYSLSAILLAKKSINAALELSLNDGLELERQLFHSTFSLVTHSLTGLERSKRRDESILGETDPQI